MKKIVFLAAMLSIFILFNTSAIAAHPSAGVWYECKVNAAGGNVDTGNSVALLLTEKSATPLFSGTYYAGGIDASTKGRLLATALTAMSMGKLVSIYFTSKSGTLVIQFCYLTDRDT